MKRIIASTLCVVVLGAQAFAGNYVPEPRPENELNVSYGVVSVPSFSYMVGGILATAFSLGLAAMDDFSSTGAITVGYYHYLNNHVAIGCDATIENVNLKMKAYSGKDESGKACYETDPAPANEIFLSVMPGVKLPWFNCKHFGMYSKVNLGAMLQYSPEITEYKEGSDSRPVKEVTPAESSVSFAGQVDPVGMEFGGTSFRGFLELGFGMEGFAKLGLRYAF